MNKLGFLLAALTVVDVECGSTDGIRGFLREKSSSRNNEFDDKASTGQLFDSEVSFTKHLMNSLSFRYLESSEICLPSESYCDSDTSPCCQGGCTTDNTCHCQNNDGLCFNAGKEDNFCCSNKCGTNGRCVCVEEEESCAAGDFCCSGLTCRDGKCIDSGSNDESPVLFDLSSR